MIAVAALQDALNSVGINTSVQKYDVSIPLLGNYSIKIDPYLPSKTFEAIKENNPYGIYIKRQ